MTLLLAAFACHTPDAIPKDSEAGSRSTTDSGVPTTTTTDSAIDTNTTPTDSDSGPVDADGDGVPAKWDCDDTDPTVSPWEPDVCNGVDDNCDGAVDERHVCDRVILYQTRGAEVEDGAFLSGWLGYRWVHEATSVTLCTFMGDWTASEPLPGCPDCDWAFALTLEPPVFDGTCNWLPGYEDMLLYTYEVELDPPVENWGYLPFVIFDEGNFGYENMYHAYQAYEWSGSLYARVPYLGRDYVDVSGTTFEWGGFPRQVYYYRYPP